MVKLAAALLVLSACSTPSMLTMIGGGPSVPVGDGLAKERGFGVRAALGVDDGGLQASFRRADDTQELALGLMFFKVTGGGYDILKSGLDGAKPGAFIRFGINLLEWDRVGTDDGAGIGGPTLEVGLGMGLGACISASASRDFRFNDRDDTFIGVNLSACALVERKTFSLHRR